MTNTATASGTKCCAPWPGACASVRSEDIAVRWGGEEFLLVLPDTDAAEAASLAEDLRRRVADSPVENGPRSIAVTISFGVAQYRAGDSINELACRADEAMYRAKREGRNRVCLDGDAGAGSAQAHRR